MTLGFGRCLLLLGLVFPVLVEAFRSCCALVTSGAGESTVALKHAIWAEMVRGGGALTVLAMAGYGMARWRFFRQQSMSLEELREEFKQEEGDPHIRAARKHEHEMLVMGEIEKRVRQAKVIIVRKTPVN